MTPQQACALITALCDDPMRRHVSASITISDIQKILAEVESGAVTLTVEEAALAADALDIAAQYSYGGDGRNELNAARGALAERLEAAQ